MKAVAKRPWPTEEHEYKCWYAPFDTQKEVDEAVRFTLSQYVTTAASCSDIKIAEMMIDSAEHYTPMTEDEQQKLLEKANALKPVFPREAG